MKNIPSLLILGLFSLAFFSCNQTKDTTTSECVAVEPEVHHLKVIFAGDLMQHGPQIEAALQPDGSYNYDEYFSNVKNEIEWADVAIANFEVTLGGKPYTGYPQFSAPDEYLKASIDGGFDLFTTSNNHSLDRGRKGLERTIMMMDSLKVPHLGTYVDSVERAQNYPYLIDENGIRIALLTFTYGTNGLRVEYPNIVNMMDTTEIIADIDKAKEMNPDVIIAMPHWGIEYKTLPSKEQRMIADWLLKNGVDHVIGGHPHVAQPLELLNDGKNLVAYSMGNLISNQSKPNTYGGYMVRMEFEKNDSTTMLSNCDYMLYWVSRPHYNDFTHQYRVLPIDEPDSLLTETECRMRDTIRSSMRDLMREHNVGEIKEFNPL